MKGRFTIALLLSILFHLILLLPIPVHIPFIDEFIKAKLHKKPEEPLSIEFIHQKPDERENVDAKRLSYETHIAKRETIKRAPIPLQEPPPQSGGGEIAKVPEENLKPGEELPSTESGKGEDVPRILRGVTGSLREDLPEEETVNLNTREFKYISYFSKIKSKIELVWNYPEIAVMRGEQGTVHLKFTIVEDGRLEDVQLIKSSGYPVLDEEAIRAVRMAAPYPPLPRSWGLKKLHIIGEFNYILGYRIIR